MFVRKVKDDVFGFGRINDDKLIAALGEFDYPNNVLEKILNFSTFVDEERGITVYLYNDKILTFKELQREYLKDYYCVK